MRSFLIGKAAHAPLASAERPSFNPPSGGYGRTGRKAGPPKPNPRSGRGPDNTGACPRRRMERAGRISAIGKRPRCRHKLDNRVQARGKRARQNEQAAAVKRSHRSIRQRSSPAWAETARRVRWQRHRARFRARSPEGDSRIAIALICQHATQRDQTMPSISSMLRVYRKVLRSPKLASGKCRRTMRSLAHSSLPAPSVLSN